jgi:hypothetical protein
MSQASENTHQFRPNDKAGEILLGLRRPRDDDGYAF